MKIEALPQSSSTFGLRPAVAAVCFFSHTLPRGERKGLFRSRVKSITVSGYPAYYVDFREPSDMDLKSVYIFQGNHGKKKADGEDGILNKLFNR